ncbi:proteasome assembly chaperone family protein [Ignicoccus islandicus]|uniref:proteasome assembly chaperone family protein n=1 Tax=Ignicoccus islandicus TaxID=54259 RepID=UPI0009462052|nr:PAC2 family protein [Ignicoccus islandicus]
MKFVPTEAAKESYEGAYLVTGFMGFGFVGALSTEYLVEKLDMVKVGFFITKYTPDQVSYSEKYSLELPFELYYHEKSNLLVLLNRWIPHEVEKFRYAQFVVKWAKKNGVKAIYGLGGLDSSFKEEPSETLRWVKTSYYNGPLPQAKPMVGGLKVIGPLAHLLIASEIEKFPMLALLPYCESASRQDPRASAIGITELAKLIKLEVDVSDLFAKAENMEKEMEKLKKILEMSVSKKDSYYI